MRKFQFHAGLASVAAIAILALVPAVAAANPNRPVCPGPAAAGSALCHARVVTDAHGTPQTTTLPKGYGPTQFQKAYGLVSAATAPSTNTIAIVDAYDDPKIASDLETYSSTYGLPECNKTNGCFRKVNQNGVEGSYPTSNSGWALEIALDVEVAHATCPKCHILLVEASSSSLANLATAVNRAYTMGAKEISNSYGGSEFSSETTGIYAEAYDHPGVAVTVASGDNGYGSFGFPAAAPNVIDVGGTTLKVNASNEWLSESVWSGTGSGCSNYVTASSWQSFLTACNGKRGVADVAAVADPNTGAAVYDTVKYQGRSGWFVVGGTSLSSPLVAAIYGLAGGLPTATTNGASSLYPHLGDESALHDITVGSDGTCSTIMCKAGAGYDGPTGVGTPIGLGAF